MLCRLVRQHRRSSTRCFLALALLYLLAQSFMWQLKAARSRTSSPPAELWESEERVTSKTGSLQEELINEARIKAGCDKVDKNAGFLVCDRLPFTKVNCGNRIRKQDAVRSYRVPDIVHFVWVGQPFLMKHFHQYLSIRSVASIQRPLVIYIHLSHGTDVEISPLWRRMLNEVPCVKVLKADPPTHAFGQKMRSALSQSDFFRLLILQRYGGVYLDFDVITLRPYDALRAYDVTIGRSLVNKISNGIILSAPQASFLRRWINTYVGLDRTKYKPFSYFGLVVPYELYDRDKSARVHLESTSMNRPNPFLDGLNSTSSENVDISGNYFLHIHPQVFSQTHHEHLLDIDEHRIRVMDSTFGAAARAALFGSTDLVFLRGETPFPKKVPKTLYSLPPPRYEDPSVFKRESEEGFFEKLLRGFIYNS